MYRQRTPGCARPDFGVCRFLRALAQAQGKRAIRPQRTQVSRQAPHYRVRSAKRSKRSSPYTAILIEDALAVRRSTCNTTVAGH